MKNQGDKSDKIQRKVDKFIAERDARRAKINAARRAVRAKTNAEILKIVRREIDVDKEKMNEKIVQLLDEEKKIIAEAKKILEAKKNK